jgi:hypothetical protein
VPYVLALGLLPVPVLTAAARTHRYWMVQVIFAAGTALLLAYPPALAFALAAALGLVPARDKSLSAMGIVGLVFLLALAPAAWALLCTRRLRYWQAGAPASAWEPGSETPPGLGALPTPRRPGLVQRRDRDDPASGIVAKNVVVHAELELGGAGGDGLGEPVAHREG